MLLGADVRLDVLSPTQARITIELAVAAERSVELTLATFPDSAAPPEVLLRQEGDARALPLAGGEGQVVRLSYRPRSGVGPASLSYLVQAPDRYAYRFPLLVPTASPDADGAAIAIQVTLPPGARFSGDGFPKLAVSEERGGREVLRGRAAAMPGFVHVVFSDRRPWIARHHLIEIVALLVVAVPAIGMLRSWRRRGGGS